MTSDVAQWGPSGMSLMLLRLFGGMILDSTCRQWQRVASLLMGGIPVGVQVQINMTNKKKD